MAPGGPFFWSREAVAPEEGPQDRMFLVQGGGGGAGISSRHPGLGLVGGRGLPHVGVWKGLLQALSSEPIHKSIL